MDDVTTPFFKSMQLACLSWIISHLMFVTNKYLSWNLVGYFEQRRSSDQIGYCNFMTWYSKRHTDLWNLDSLIYLPSLLCAPSLATRPWKKKDWQQPNGPIHYTQQWADQGAVSVYEFRITSIGIPMTWKRRSTVLSLTWGSPYLGKTVILLRRGLGREGSSPGCLAWHWRIDIIVVWRDMRTCLRALAAGWKRT